MVKNIRRFRINGTGCCLVDYLFHPVDFSGGAFRKYISVSAGDGGLTIGGLVFTEELEEFSRKQYTELRDEITGGAGPVASNVGGPSVVSLIHTAQMLHGTVAEVVFHGCRGNDSSGVYLEETVTKTPLSAIFRIKDEFTPFTDVLSDPGYNDGLGERMFINNIGAAGLFTPVDLDETFFQADIVAFGGTALVPGIHRSLDTLLEKAVNNGAITVVNTVYDFISEKNDPASPWPVGNGTECYRYIDLLISDREEALRHSGMKSVNEAVRYFMDHGVGAVIVTSGADPVTFSADSNLTGSVGISTLPVSENVKADIINKRIAAGDTTGCGDNFAGGVIASMARQMISAPGRNLSLKEAVAFGIASGGFACYYLGGTFLESRPGEKLEKVTEIHQEYLRCNNM